MSEKLYVGTLIETEKFRLVDKFRMKEVEKWKLESDFRLSEISIELVLIRQVVIWLFENS